MATCKRCNEDFGVTLAMIKGFNFSTNRCANCERENHAALLRFREAFKAFIADLELTEDEWWCLKNGASAELLDWDEAVRFVKTESIFFLLSMASLEDSFKFRRSPEQFFLFEATFNQLVNALGVSKSQISTAISTVQALRSFHAERHQKNIEFERHLQAEKDRREREAVQREVARQRVKDEEKQRIWNAIMSEFNDETLADRLSVKRIHPGDTERMVTIVLGPPEEIDYKFLKTKVKDVWKYYRNQRGGYGYKIVLESGKVTGWA